MKSAHIENAMNRVASRAAIKVNDSDVLGLGSGSAVAKFAKTLGARVRKEKLKIQIIPSSIQALLLARENGLPLFPDSAHCPAFLDLAFDGADQISTETRSMIKGGGGQLLKEKIILSSSRQNYILIDHSKVAKRLTRSVPVEVVHFAVDSAREKIEKGFNSRAEIRKLEKGYPYYTESGNLILDVEFGEIKNPLELESALKRIPGVVEVGIFNLKVSKFFVANQVGGVDLL